MAERHSQYDRIPGDLYVTPEWVWEALYAAEPWSRGAWDCAPVDSRFDFLAKRWPMRWDIATNPPFKRAPEFCRHALRNADRVAMLLPIAFDCRESRRDLFADNQAFKAKYVLTERIRWTNLEQKEAGPSAHHAWYVWDRTHTTYPRQCWLFDKPKGP